jgi:hypothetical protein
MFHGTVAVLLGGVAFAKVHSLITGQADFHAYDPLLTHFRQGWVMVAAAGLELAVAAAMVLGRDPALRSGTVLWLSVVLVLYRLGLWAIGHAGNCNCLGRPASWWFTLQPGVAEFLLKGMLAYMLAGSAALWWWRQRREAAGAGGRGARK